MELPNGEVLMHGARPYDPKKAHEYYLRTRKLKGRRKGQYNPHLATLAKRLAGMSDEQIHEEIRKSNNPAEKKLIKIMLTRRQAKSTPPAKPKATPEQRANAARRVSSLKSELADLERKLKEAVAKARKSAAKERRGPTQAEKSKKAKESKKYRDKHKQKLANKRKTAASKSKASGKPKADTVTSLKKQVSEVKGRLDKAIQAQKALG